MFQDVGVSKDLNEQFKRHLQGSTDPLDSECLSLPFVFNGVFLKFTLFPDCSSFVKFLQIDWSV